jgi:PqqD family protein of HPr-rel-A system
VAELADQTLWHVGRTVSLSWAEFPDQPDVAAVFHSGNGQTFAVDAFGREMLRLLESGPMTQFELFTALVKTSLLTPDQEGRQQLSNAMRQLHASAIISRHWPSDDPTAA